MIRASHAPRRLLAGLATASLLGAVLVATYGGTTAAAKPTAAKQLNVTVTAPTSGEVVSGTTTLSASSPNVKQVTWYVDGHAVATATGSGSTHSAPWNSTTVADGGHQIYAVATGGPGGRSGTSPTVNFTVRNSTATSTPTATPAPTATPTPTPTPTATPTPTPTSTPAPTATAHPSATVPCGVTTTVPAWQHVVWILMENKSYSEIIGSSAAPYINSIAQKCGVATNMTAVTHPSLPNYIALTSGSTQGITDDNPPSAHPLNVPSIFSQLGSGWRALDESMPVNCDKNDAYPYAVRHNPAAYYTNIATQCSAQDVPLGSTPDISARFTFITPNVCNDMHDCSVSTGDTWLSRELPMILNSAQYQAGNTAVILTWDEDDSSASNHIPTVVISPSTAAGTRSSTAFTHYSVLRSTEEMLGLSLLGNAGTASDMRSAFRLG